MLVFLHLEVHPLSRVCELSASELFRVVLSCFPLLILRPSGSRIWILFPMEDCFFLDRKQWCRGRSYLQRFLSLFVYLLCIVIAVNITSRTELLLKRNVINTILNILGVDNIPERCNGDICTHNLFKKNL